MRFEGKYCLGTTPKLPAFGVHFQTSCRLVDSRARFSTLFFSPLCEFVRFSLAVRIDGTLNGNFHPVVLGGSRVARSAVCYLGKVVKYFTISITGRQPDRYTAPVKQLYL